MRVFIGTEKQIKARKIIERTIVWLLCPLWIPLTAVLFLLTYMADILENIVLNGSSDMVSKFSSWLSRKLF